MGRRRRLPPLGAAFLLLPMLLLQPSCGERVREERSGREGGSEGRLLIRVVFDMPGDDRGSPEYREILEAIKAAIVEKRAGEIIRSEHGMGSMEIVIRPDDEGSVGKLKRIIITAYPGARYRIERTFAQ